MPTPERPTERPAEHPAEHPAELREAIAPFTGGPAAPWARVAGDGRHQVWRAAARPQPLIVKVYLPATDRYYAHRWRREERALDLLDRYAAGAAPRPLAALHAAGRWAALVMQDIGGGALADGLPDADADARLRALEAALRALDTCNAVTHRWRAMFRALAYQADLDRVTRETLERRYASAFTRLGGAAADVEPTAHARRASRGAPWDLIDALIRPLLRAPRRVIHNGFSPLNLLWRGGRLVVIDWETLAAAPAELDLADLCTFPEWGDPAWMARQALRAVDERGLRREAFWAAAAERSLTYAATSRVRARRVRAADRALAARYAQRRAGYLDWFDLACAELIANRADRRRLRDAAAAFRRGR